MMGEDTVSLTCWALSFRAKRNVAVSFCGGHLGEILYNHTLYDKVTIISPF